MGNNYNFTEANKKLFAGGRKKIQAKDVREYEAFSRNFNNQMFVKWNSDNS